MIVRKNRVRGLFNIQPLCTVLFDPRRRTIDEKGADRLSKNTSLWILIQIGFTTALFIGGRALSGALLDAAKVGVMIGSALSAVVGMVLIFGLRRQNSAGAVRAPDGVETD